MTALPEGFSIYNDLYDGCIETTLYLTEDSLPYEHRVPLGDLVTQIVVGHSCDDGSMSDEGYHELEDLRESLVKLIEGIDAVFEDDFGNDEICDDCMNSSMVDKVVTEEYWPAESYGEGHHLSYRDLIHARTYGSTRAG